MMRQRLLLDGVALCGLTVGLLSGCGSPAAPSAASPTPSTGAAAPVASPSANGEATNGEMPPAEASPAEAATAEAPPQEPTAPPAPATAAVAARTIDLRTLPLPDGAETTAPPTLAQLGYAAPGAPTAAFRFVQETLVKQGWKELEGSYVTEQSASGTFARDGFRLSVTATPGRAAGQSAVRVLNHGNVAPDRLPLPEGATPLFAGPVSAMFVTAAPVEETAAAVKDLLLERGWIPYGSAGDVAYYRRNAMRISARVATAPAQGGKTIIDYATQLLSVELPAPDDALDVRYVDGPIQLSFDTPASLQEVHDYYREALAPAGWKPTTETPIKIGFRHFFILRNEAGDLVEANLQTVDGQTRVMVKFQTAEEVAEAERRAEEALAKKKRQHSETKPADTPTQPLALPAGAKPLEAQPRSLKLSVPSGQAQAVAAALGKQLTDAGFEQVAASLEKMAGTIVLGKEKGTVSIVYLDLGLGGDAEVTATAIGVDLELVTAAEKE